LKRNAALSAMLLIFVGMMIALLVLTKSNEVENYANKIATAVAYETAINNVDANALAALAKNTSGAMGDLALFQAYMLNKDVAKLEKLASDGDTSDFRDLAKLHIVGIRGNDMTAGQIEKYLSSLNTKKSPFYYTGALTVAQKYLAEGDVKRANNWLDKIINDADAPSVISGIAQSLR
jgi:hypothetical protein